MFLLHENQMLMGIFQNTVHQIYILRVPVSASRSPVKITFLITLHWLIHSFFFLPFTWWNTQCMSFLKYLFFSKIFFSEIWKVQEKRKVLADLDSKKGCRWLWHNGGYGGYDINGLENLQDCWYWLIYGGLWTQLSTCNTASSFNEGKIYV